MLNKKVFELQSEFLRRLSCHEPPQEHCVPSLLRCIIECDDDLIDFALGKLGQKLSMFAKNVDFQHPGIANIFDGLIANDQDFAQECMELLILARYARDNNLKRIIPTLSKFITKDSLDQNAIKKIDAPVNNRMHVRLLKDFKEREEIRMTKRMQIIDLHSVYKKDEEIWNAQPDNFNKFLRFDTSYQDDIELAEKKAVRYEELGCESLASEIRNSIVLFRNNIDQSYYGFNRITMTNASVILAKSLGYNYVSPEEISYSKFMSYGSWKTESKITVDRSFFGKYNFDPEQTIEFSPIISSLSKSPIFTKKNQIPYNYEPRVYPIHELSDIMTDNVCNVISTLENFPDAGYKPIFDHFGVIVPGVSFPVNDPMKNNKMYSFSDERGMIHSYSIRETALKTLDSILIKGEYFYGILVGEKDSKCYFISYFL